ncbi:hypothetical protein [Methyloceanibacter caenitepidi]|uniref:Lipoprotein n=1 Tax=Methyloceanibacter caenitepidi TaxID=1384459 RepID=A0A0A8K3W8_9HYPH|nr:hypothetical protein [Methyloceanibacter caenitepidi]BAQ17461.1 hypothetical protein GL4_2012 [Methyloceanibacter caenitepidi]
MYFLQSAYRLAAVLSVILLSGCASSLPDQGPLQRFSDAIRSYDNTLTKSEREAAITDLKQEKDRQEAQVKQVKSTPKTN